MFNRAAAITLSLVIVLISLQATVKMTYASEQNIVSDSADEDRSHVVYEEQYGMGDPIPVTQEHRENHRAEILSSGDFAVMQADAGVMALRCWSKSQDFGNYQFTHRLYVSWCGDSVTLRISNVSSHGMVVSTNWATSSVGQIAHSTEYHIYQGVTQGATIFLQHHYCHGWGPVGCIGNKYPWISYTVWSNGNVSWQTGGY